MENLQSNQKITQSPLFKFVILEFICMVLMISDKNNQLAQPIRDTLSLAVIPLIKIVEWPQTIYQTVEIAVSRQAQLIDENSQLKERLLNAELQVQQNISLAAENQRLRNMLAASQNSPLTTSVAFVSNITQNTSKHQIVIDQGSVDGLFEGQTVLNLAGVIGQVDVLSRHFAHVILISDYSHAIPVEVLRTGLRTIAYGRGDHIFLAEIPSSANIQVGDVLVTSGFGNRFPRGLKLAEVQSLSVSPERTFKTAQAKPFAEFSKLTEVFLVWPNEENTNTDGITNQPKDSQSAETEVTPSSESTDMRTESEANE